MSKLTNGDEECGHMMDYKDFGNMSLWSSSMVHAAFKICLISMKRTVLMIKSVLYYKVNGLLENLTSGIRLLEHQT